MQFLIKNKLFVGAIILALITFIVVVFLSFSSRETQTPSGVNPSITPSVLNRPNSLNELEQQTQADENVNTIQNSVLKEYPWYLSLPLEEKTYFVYFDLEKKSFTGLLYPKTSAGISIDEQVTLMKKEILIRLVNLGVDTKEHPVNWQVKPE